MPLHSTSTLSALIPTTCSCWVRRKRTQTLDAFSGAASESTVAGSNDAAKADVAGRGVDGLRVACSGSVAETVIGGAEMGAPFEHLAGNPDSRKEGIEALLHGATARHDGRAAGTRFLVGMSVRVPVAGPLPDVSCHVVEAISIGRERSHRGRAFVVVGQEVLPGELPLPGIGHHSAPGCKLVSPDVGGTLQPSPRRSLPLRLGWKRFAGPGS